MGRAPCCSGDHAGLKKGPWTHEEDQKLKSFLLLNPDTSWRLVPPKAGLLRCGKSCRLRWMNYLRPDIKRGNFTPEEENLIIQIHSVVGNKWSVIASQLPGRTDNEIKNLWNTKLRKLLVLKGINPITHQPLCNPHLSSYVKQWVKSLENVIIAGLMTHSSSDNNNCNPIDNPIEAPLSYSMSDQPPQQPLGVEDFTQTYLPNPIYDHSSATSTGIINPISDHSSTTTTTTTTINDTCFWVDETFQNYGSFIDDLMFDEGESLPSSLNDHVREVLEEKASSPVIEMVSSDAPVNWEEGLKYWN